MEMNDQEREQYLAVIKDAALKIDPETAEVFWDWGSVRDPYYLYEHGDDWEDNAGPGPVLQEATCGFCLATCPPRPETP
jgi:hypothetical protein